ncbi:MAG: hypothetical protein GY870_07250 [archaeon]|nr:hypothetical protein [archaeon]
MKGKAISVYKKSDYKRNNQRNKGININWLLEREVRLISKYEKDQILLFRYFKKIFGFSPRFLFSNKFGMIYFISDMPSKLLNKRLQKEIFYFRKKINKRVYFITYPNTLEDLIRNLFSHVTILKIECVVFYENIDEEISWSSNLANDSIRSKKIPVNFFVRLEDKQMPLALGGNGHYIHLVNGLLRECIGNFTIFLRS